MNSYNNKTVWITGASAGIGEELALGFAKEGARLVLSARREDALQVVAEKCKAAGATTVLIQPLDLSDSAGFVSIAKQVAEKLGTVDVLVNNGGRSQRSLTIETPMELYRQLMEVNYFGAVALTKAVLPYMLKQKSGQIITISSLVGKIGSPYRSGYAAGKHALHGFFDSLRSETISDNIEVMMVCPGFIRTNISINAVDASGNATGKMDENQAKGMMPSKAAAIIIKAAKSGKQEINVGGKETLILTIKRLFPNMVNKIVSKQLNRE